MDKSTIRRNIKANAKLMLKNNLGTAILVLFIPMLVYLGLSMFIQGILTAVFGVQSNDLNFNTFNNHNYVFGDGTEVPAIIAAVLLTLICLLIFIPLIFGITSWFVSLSEGKKKSLGTIFDWFSSFDHFIKSVLLMLNVFVRYLIYSLPVMILFGGMAALEYLGPNYVNFNYVAIMAPLDILYFAAAFALNIFLLRYSLVTYLCVRFPEKKINEIIKDSVRLMKGHKWEFFVFSLSFILWMLLGFLTCGLALLWVLPYMSGASIIFCNYVYDVGTQPDFENGYDQNPNANNNFNGSSQMYTPSAPETNNEPSQPSQDTQDDFNQASDQGQQEQKQDDDRPESL
ncbi:MAG: DUF975 family protein [Bacillota bacterium]|nr:DUF975 family protein [Bacillota bacterium]